MPYSLPELLLASAYEDPGRPFLFFAGRTHSRAEIAYGMRRVAGWLQRGHFAEGDTVALLLSNQPDFVVAWLGATLAGARVLSLDPAAPPEENAALLDEARPRVVIARPSAMPAVRAIRDWPSSLRTVIVGGAGTAGTTRWSTVMDGDPAHGLSRSDGALSTAAGGMARLLGIDEQDRIMLVLPLSCTAAQQSLAMAISTGASIVLERAFSPATFWTRARNRGATQVSVAGWHLSQLYARPTRRNDSDHPIRQVLSVGTPTEIHEGFEHRFGVCVVEAFGSREAGFITVNPAERGRRKLGTAGLPVPWREVVVLDDAMLPVPPGIVGRICSRPRLQAPGGDHWQHTGAFGATDEEGFLTVLGPPTRCYAALLRQASS